MKKKYTEQINIRITAEQLKSLKKNAHRCGLSVSKYVRKISTEKDPRFLSKEDRNEIQELKSVGLEIKRTLNLYHKKRSAYAPFLAKLRSTINKVSSK